MTSTKKTSQQKPKWTDPVLQALAFWIGYKKELFRSHLINEGALVAEIASLINANKSDGDVVSCETTYENIDGVDITNLRADITISKNKIIHTVIEVKRDEAGTRRIQEDALKLTQIKESNPHIHCFQIIVSQGKIPRKYVSNKGVSYRKEFKIHGTKFSTRAIRVCKSNSSFKKHSLKKANYVCLIQLIKSTKNYK